MHQNRIHNIEFLIFLKFLNSFSKPIIMVEHSLQSIHIANETFHFRNERI